MKKLFKKLFSQEKTVEIPEKLAMQICRYCEDKQVYDKLGYYGDFYYKLLKIVSED